MNRSPWLLFTAAIVTGAIAGGALWMRARERDLDDFERAVVAKLAANHRLATAARTSSAKLRQPGAASASTLQPSAAKAPADPDVKSAWITRALSQMPEYKAWQRGNWQVAVMREYMEWLATLNVTSERRQQIKAALLDYITMRQERFSALTASGLANTSKEFGERYKRDDDALNSQIKQELTPDEFASFQRYSQTQGWVRRIPEINMYLAERGAEPLSAAQRATLIDIFAEAKAWTPPAGLPFGTTEQMRTARIGELARQRIEGPQGEALVGYIAFVNEKARIAAQLLKPADPDSAYPWSSPSF